MSAFQKAIEEYIKRESNRDKHFAEKVKDPAKNIKDCLSYIMCEVGKISK